MGSNSRPCLIMALLVCLTIVGTQASTIRIRYPPMTWVPTPEGGCDMGDSVVIPNGETYADFTHPCANFTCTDGMLRMSLDHDCFRRTYYS